MVIESLISPFKAEKKPYELLFYGFFYATVSLFLSLLVFKEHSSLLMVFLTVMAAMPLMYRTMKLEEKKDTIFNSEMRLLKEHGRAIEFLLFLFLGITIGFTFWYLVLPNYSALGESFFFKVQKDTLVAINGRVTGNVIKSQIFWKILINNIKVLVFCVLFSFLYGLGALFILIWNASVIATAIGDFIRPKGISFMSVGSGFLRYLVHGIPEIAAYFVGGLAGGIVSFAVIKHHFRTKKFESILLDSSELMIISVLILVAAALVEVYVTPLFFA